MATRDYRKLYEDSKDQQIAEGFKDLKVDIKEVKDAQSLTNKHLEKVNGRVGKIEDKVFPDVPQTVQQLPSLWRDPQVIKLAVILATAIVLGIIVFAGLKGISLPKGIF